MKTLFVLRHAKSSWDHPELSDFERPLNKRGLKAARFMGELMRARSLAPQRIVSSPARRAQMTAQIVSEAAGFDFPVRFDERIYEASPLTLFNLIREFDDRIDSVLLIGHNPGFENLVRLLTNETVGMPTAALAAVELRIDAWREISVGVNRLEFLLQPKEEMKKMKDERSF